MNTYIVKIEVSAEVQAFSEDDAKDYINDIFGLDEEIKSIKISSIREK
jgi:hypothetical protein